jgi:hypothetical protein
VCEQVVENEMRILSIDYLEQQMAIHYEEFHIVVE